MAKNQIYEPDLTGTNDTITSGRDLRLEYLFTDGDTRTTTLPNPRTDLTENEINLVSTTLTEDQVFIGDKDGAGFDKINHAEITEWTKTKLDLS